MKTIMNKIFRISALAAAGIMSVQLSAFAGFAGFPDMPEGEMGAALQRAVDNGLIGGFDDGEIKPDAYITRAQMATIISRAFGATQKSSKTFPDVAANAWYSDDVSKAVYMGAFSGDTEGKFNPDNNISFQETYTVLSRVLCLDSYSMNYTDGSVEYINKPADDVLDGFADKDSVASWALDSAKYVVGNGGFKGIDGLLRGSDPISRGQFAMLMDSLVGTYIDSADNVTVDPSKSVMIRVSDAALGGLKTDRNLIIGYSVNNCTLQDAEVKGVTAVYGCIDKIDAQSSDDLVSKISLGGTFNDVRIMSSGISLDVSGAKTESIRGKKNSRINLGVIGG